MLGDALLDVTARPDGEVRSGEDVPAEIHVLPGGQGANIAVRLGRSGIGVRLVCGMADDGAGRLLTAALEREPIAVAPMPVAATGAVVIVLDASGERTMLSRRAPFAGSVAETDLPAAPWTVVSGYLLMEPDGAAAAAVLAARDTRRVLVGCAVPASARARWRSSAVDLRADLLILNAEEARHLGPLEDLAPHVVVTSPSGATARIGGLTATVDHGPETRGIDSTGAGDGFAAALLARLVHAAWPPPLAALEAALAESAATARQIANATGAQAPLHAERGHVGG